MSLIVTPVVPDSFGDSSAKSIAWQPLCPGGTNYRSVAFGQRSDTVYCIRPTLTSQLIFHLILLWGVSLLLLVFLVILEEGWDALSLGETVALGCGLTFVAIGLLLRRKLPRPHLFDLAARECRLNGGAELLPLSAIRALQMIEMEVSRTLVHSGIQNTFFSYELNLVLADGSRRQLFNQAGLRHARCDAGKLAEVLRIPFWDGSRVMPL